MAINFIKTDDINNGISSDSALYISKCEQIYSQRLSEAAEKIYLDAKERPLVLISGPSGSGKTTSALRIGKRLQQKKLTVHIISMDNYFLPKGMGEMPLDENGKVDLESPLRMDIPLFTDHLEKLSRCEPIMLPKFNFITQSRSFSETLCRKKGEIVIIEGIHALNPMVTGKSDDYTTCIYVSVRTRIQGSDEAVLHPRTIRLMRRLCRDNLFRGRNISEVMEMLPGVTRGEDLYIMPHKHRAHFDIDTFHAYEPLVYRTLLLPELEKSNRLSEYSKDCDVLLKILRELNPADVEIVPSDSLIREFIGGSSFVY